MRILCTLFALLLFDFQGCVNDAGIEDTKTQTVATSANDSIRFRATEIGSEDLWSITFSSRPSYAAWLSEPACNRQGFLG